MYLDQRGAWAMLMYRRGLGEKSRRSVARANVQNASWSGGLRFVDSCLLGALLSLESFTQWLDFPSPHLIHAQVRIFKRATTTTFSLHNITHSTMDTINVLISSFAGLSLPRTLSLPVPADTSIAAFTSLLSTHLPPYADSLLLSTTTRRIDTTSTSSLSSLLSDNDSPTFLPLHLSARLLGGKGGFGSQLRAAGGRMSSRKNRNRNPDQINGSNRNLDGRRLRTITEAKNLAEYLALKPEMDKKEKEERRKRWEAVVEAAERKEEELRKGDRNARLDGEWVEAKEEVEQKTRDAVLAAMKAGLIEGDKPLLERTGSESSAAEGEGSDAQPEASSSASSDNDDVKVTKPAAATTRAFYGWDDEDDEFMSSDEEGEDVPAEYEGKGKAKA